MDDRINRRLLAFTYAAGFVFGLALCFDSVFMPEFKTWFDLDYTRQMYIIFCKNIPFIFFSIPIGLAIRKTGYKNCLALSMLCFALGTWLLVPGLRQRNYPLLLFAFFINGIAFNLELVSWNPLLAILGSPQGAGSRLNLGNALGAIAQIIAPFCIFLFIPRSIESVADKLPYIVVLFVVLAIGLCTFGLVALMAPGKTGVAVGSIPLRFSTRGNGTDSIWRNRRVLGSFVAIFLLLGAEAGMFGLYRNFLEDPAIAGFTSHKSQQYFMIYFALFAAGRLTAWIVQRRVSPASQMLFHLLAATVLMTVAILTRGLTAIGCLTAAGFFVAIFFPSLYATAIQGLGRQTSVASGLLSMGMLGAAVLPILQGWLADRVGIQRSFWIVLGPYGYTLIFLLSLSYSRRSGRPAAIRTR